MTDFIKELSIKKYRSLKNARFRPRSTLSVLIGFNGAGKSNTLQAILLCQKAFTVRGRFSEEEKFDRNCTIIATIEHQTITIRYKFVIGYTTDQRNVDLVKSAKIYWKMPGLADTEWHELPGGSRRDRWITYTIKKRLVLQDKPRLSEKMIRLHEIASEASELFMSIEYYSASVFTNPNKAPASFNFNPTGRWESQDNPHEKFLRDLFVAYTGKEKSFYEYESVIGKKTLCLVDKIRFKIVELPSSQIEVQMGGKYHKTRVKNRIVVPYFRRGRSNFSPNQLSEGTLKSLALLFYIITAKNKVVLIEEPENCIHFGLLRKLMNIINDFAREKQIIVTTHADEVVSTAKSKEVFIVENAKTEGTTIKSIPDAMSRNELSLLKSYLAESGNLGDFWREGSIKNA